MNTIRTASGRQLRATGLHETALPIESDPTIMPGARLLGADGQIYESIKNLDTGIYTWQQRGTGPSIQLQKTSTEIQWRVTGGNDTWKTLALLQDLAGPQGVIGLPGAGLSFRGNVATVANLPTTSTTGYGYKVDATSDIWVWNGTAWVNMGPAVQGPPGAKGDQGITGSNGAAVELRKTLAAVEWRLAGQATWTTLVALDDIKGPVGDNGAEGPAGPGFSYRGAVATVGNLPTSSTQGHAYKVTATSDLYIYNGLAWVNAGQLQGPKGDTGERGPTGDIGPGLNFRGNVATVGALPSPSTQGFAYKVEATGDFYIYNGLTWISLGSLQGPKGDTGNTGSQGLQGETGASLSFRGTVATVAALPGTSTTGYSYRVDATGDFYIYSGLAWVNAGTLAGPKGDQGNTGPAGAGFSYRGSVATVAALPSPSTNGFAYKVESTGDLHVYNGSSWVNAGPLQGPKGDTGNQGPQGIQGIQGFGFNYQGTAASIGSLPSPSTQGFAYRVGTDLYIYNGTSWVNAGALQGPKGDQGDTGTTGATGAGFSYRGSVTTIAGLPSPSTTGFGYKVESSGDLYIYNGTAWVNAGPLQGPQGIQGLQGIQGPQGSQGPAGVAGTAGGAGPQGPTGPQGPQGAKGDTGDIGVATATAPITYDSATKAVGITAATTSAAGSMSAPDKSRLDALATSGTPQFAGLGLGTAAVSGWELTVAGGMAQNRLTLTASSDTYTLDVTAANEFVAGASISGAITVNLSNLASIPTGYVWRGVFTFPVAATAGTITWFPGNTGYTQKWDGTGSTAMTLTASQTEKVVIEVVGGTTFIEVAALQGRA